MIEEDRYEKKINWNINLPDERRFKNEYVIIDNERDEYEALPVDMIVDILNEQDQEIKDISSDLNDAVESLYYELDMKFQYRTQYFNCKQKIQKLESENANLKAQLQLESVSRLSKM